MTAEVPRVRNPRMDRELPPSLESPRRTHRPPARRTRQVRRVTMRRRQALRPVTIPRTPRLLVRRRSQAQRRRSPVGQESMVPLHPAGMVPLHLAGMDSPAGPRPTSLVRRRRSLEALILGSLALIPTRRLRRSSLVRRGSMHRRQDRRMVKAGGRRCNWLTGGTEPSKSR